MQKQKTFHKLRLFQSAENAHKKLTALTEEKDKLKRKAVYNSLQADQKKILINQQKIALKRQLVVLDTEYNKLKLKLDKEV